MKCGDNISPDILGIPVAYDNEETEPTLTYMDVHLRNCALIRVWTAIDEAGNVAVANQTIEFESLVAPIPSDTKMITVACSSVDDVHVILSNISLSVTHLCERPIMLDYVDSINITYCGLTFNRT